MLCPLEIPLILLIFLNIGEPMNTIKTLLMSLSIICSMAFSFASFAAQSAETVLITGANRGIGLALAKQFTEAGYSVIGTARTPAKATELASLGVRIEQLDVSDAASVAAFASSLKGQSIDILINNAGVIGHNAKTFAELDIEQLDGVYTINALGPMRVTQALLSNLESSERKLVANISSMMGSMELNTWGCCMGYRASKAALNSFNKTLAVEMGKQGYVFVVLHPGYVKTDMNKGAGAITTLDSATGLFTVISQLKADDNGKFYDFNGKAMPW